MAPMRLDRLYRSNALLLPDGRVMTAWSNPARRINEPRIELFCPPYLYRGERPEISGYPPNISYGQEFKIETKDANDIIAVALMRPTATTHGTNSEQRYVGLEFDRRNSSLLARVPMNRNILPPGYYMLFILKNEDIPSRGKFILISWKTRCALDQKTDYPGWRSRFAFSWSFALHRSNLLYSICRELMIIVNWRATDIQILELENLATGQGKKYI